MTEKDFVIVIGRQFGSGGREIGRRIAEKLGIPYFDKNLLAEAAKAFGFDKDVLADADEKRPSFIRTFLGSSYGNTSDFGCWGSLSPDALYDVQSRVIGRICHAGPCVIVGRTADYIARELTNLFSVFIHSPEAHRARRIVMRNDAADEAEAIRIAKKGRQQKRKLLQLLYRTPLGRGIQLSSLTRRLNAIHGRDRGFDNQFLESTGS